MDTRDSRFELPAWLVAVLLVAVGASAFYGVVVRRSLAEPLALWFGIFQIAVGLFVVYLLYRFVLAVEKIADKL